MLSVHLLCGTMEKPFSFKHFLNGSRNTHITNKLCGPNLEDFDVQCVLNSGLPNQDGKREYWLLISQGQIKQKNC